MVYYIVHTEPVNVQSGNLARFFLRHFDEKEGRGHSLFIDHPVDLIVPSFEMPREEAESRLEQMIHEFPDFRFGLKDYSRNKKVIWAVLNDKKRKKELPKFFLKDKASASMLLRFFYPPFMIVDVQDGQLKLPQLESAQYIDPEICLADTSCVLDIETTKYHDPDLERITNTVLNFGYRKVIFTAFRNLHRLSSARGYDIIKVHDTDGIKKAVLAVIKEEDPLMIYGFNIAFDQEKLRELGEIDFRVGVDGSVPVFKSVQAIRNMIEKGRWVIDLYGYLFYHRNIFKDNRLVTHCNGKKSLSHVELEAKTNLAESNIVGSSGAAREIAGVYVPDDGDMTRGLAIKYCREMFAKAWFSKREPSTICTSSGRNVAFEMSKERYFHRRSTFMDRFDYGKPEGIEFDPEKKIGEIFELERKNGCYENLHLFCPYFFIKVMWPMIEGTTGSLRFNTPDEKFNYVQTLNEYISMALERYFLIAEQKADGRFPEMIKIKNREVPLYVLNSDFADLYRMSIRQVDERINDFEEKMGNALKKAEVVNFSKKFIYVQNPGPLLKSPEGEGFGFVYGSGQTLSQGKSLASFVDGRLIIQGFSITRWLSEFEKSIIEDALLARLKHSANPALIRGYVEQRFSQIARARDYELLTAKKNDITKRVEKAVLEPLEVYEQRFFERFGNLLSY